MFNSIVNFALIAFFNLLCTSCFCMQEVEQHLLNNKIFCAIKNNNKVQIEKLIKGGLNINTAYCEGATALHFAVGFQNEAIIETLLTLGANVNLDTASRQTPLMIAYSLKAKNIMRLLCRYGADIDHVHSDGLALLHMAIKDKENDFIDFLLSLGANPNKCAEGVYKDVTPLMLAASFNLDALDILFKYGALVNLKNSIGASVLHFAAGSKCEAFTLSRLIHTYHADVNAPDNEWATPLHRAVENLDWRKALILLKGNADVNAKRNGSFQGSNVWIYNVTPLMSAVALSNFALVKILLEHNADIYSKNSLGSSAIDLAIQKNDLPILNLILEADFDKSKSLQLHERILHYGLQFNKYDIISLILKRHPSLVHTKFEAEGEFYIPLLLALFNGEAAIVDLLINYGALNCFMHKDLLWPYVYRAFKRKCLTDTFLLYLVKNECNRIIYTLLSIGFDINHKTKQGDSLLALALLNKNQALALGLIKRGINIHIVDEKERNAAFWAIYFGYSKILSILLERKISIEHFDAYELAFSKGRTNIYKVLQKFNIIRASSEELVFPKKSAIHDACYYCSKKGNHLMCGQCKVMQYCSKECQIKDWDNHRGYCKQKFDYDQNDQLRS